MDNKEIIEVHDEDTLNYAAGKAEAHRQQAYGYQKMAQDAYNYWMKKAHRELKAVQDIKDKIAQYAVEQRHANPRWSYKKSPFVRIIWSKPKNEVTLANSKDLINQFKGTPYVQQTVEDNLNWGDLKKTLKANNDGVVFTEDGEVVKGAKGKKVPATMQIKHRSEKGSWTASEKL